MQRSFALSTFAVLPLLALALSACGPSQNADACTLYEAANQSFEDAITQQQSGVIDHADVRAVFRELPTALRAAADRAHGDVLVEMQKSAEYAAAYEARQTKDIGTAHFLQQNNVVDACKEDGAEINASVPGHPL